jgi:ribonuclease BN (tRNA processing enzyme)
MKITFLGTGTCIANSRRRHPGILIEINGSNFLFDCGSGTVYQLEKLGVKVSEIKHLFITHLHPDHTLDYITIVHDRILSTRKKLKVYGPRGLKLFTNTLFTQVYPGLSQEGKCFKIIRVKEVYKGLVEKGNKWMVSSAPVDHDGGVAYKVKSGNKSVLYSGDTAPCKSLIQLGLNVDIAILECSYPNVESLKGKHLCPKYAGILANKMNTKKLILTHLYPKCYGKEREMRREIKKYYSEEVTFAEDGMVIEV